MEIFEVVIIFVIFFECVYEVFFIVGMWEVVFFGELVLDEENGGCDFMVCVKWCICK